MSNKNEKINKNKNFSQVDFYSIFIKAIEDNKDNILNKKECIHKIKELKKEKEGKKLPKLRLKDLIPKPRIRNKENKYFSNTISNFKDVGKLKEKKLDSENNNNNKSNINNNINNINDEKAQKIIQHIKNKIEFEEKENVIKNLNTNNNNNNNENKNNFNSENTDNNLTKTTLASTSKPKKKSYFRNKIFKAILLYLESNNILLSDFINKNPFQDKPYLLSNSEEFMDYIKFSNYEMIKSALLKSNDYLFTIDYYGQTCYHWAAKLGNLKMLKILTNAGRHLNIKDFKGRTPLMIATLNNNIECVKFLINNGGNPHLKDNDKKQAINYATNEKIRIYLHDAMDAPYTNPIMRSLVSNMLKRRENIINQKKLKKKILNDKNDAEKNVFDNEEEQNNN